jgi:hypothetical protein
MLFGAKFYKKPAFRLDLGLACHLAEASWWGAVTLSPEHASTPPESATKLLRSPLPARAGLMNTPQAISCVKWPVGPKIATGGDRFKGPSLHQRI